MASGATQNFTSYYQGTGAEQTIDVAGFDPRYIEITNLATGDSLTWGEGFLELAAASRGGMKTTGATGVRSFVTDALGVKPAATSGGFTVGTDAAVNAVAVKYMFVASN